MVGMNHCVFSHCTITSTCDILKVTMTELFRLAYAHAMKVSSLVLLIELCCFGINEQRNVRPAISYDDQGLVFAIAFGGYIRMFDARKYESNDGRLMLLTTMDGHIHVLDSFRGTLLSTYNVKPVPNYCTLEASFSPEGMFVISGSGDGRAYAWSVRSGKEVYPLLHLHSSGCKLDDVVTLLYQLELDEH
ncbi:WD repeat-containing protein 82-B-like isoform X2 [Hibiscus syriacus]|uniref:WD repeat-containing protein 82-B-like isoform X2 n=1 Tax=Hibiscus syriacus TaxID=106335 RepID=A0A6A3AXT9_HIBSY|nr:WD repeat-containing protein 82-B-like isoform X2 [Hibiscus syriacus]